MKTCKSLYFTDTKEKFEAIWLLIKAYMHVVVAEYLEINYMQMKEKFGVPWIKKVTHFEHIVASRAEEGHATLKKC